MYIYIYIILLIIFIVIVEVINNFQFELFGNNNSNIINKKYTYYELTDDTDEQFYYNKISINNDDKKLILFNSEVNFSPIEKFKIKHHNSSIEIDDFIGKIYFNVSEKFLDLIHIFFSTSNNEWLMVSSIHKTIYEFNLKTNIKIIYLTPELKEIIFFTNF